MQGAANRIQYLDGLRGIAIVLVILSHYWGLGWTEILPFGNRFGSIRIIEQGWVGVELFFLISGFVILLTIERCNSIKQFVYRRWLRLFPAMAIATIITVIFNHTIQPVTQFSDSPWYNAIPGLIFVSPSFLHAISHLEIDSLHRSFWTLYVEVGFYVTFALLYFSLGWKRATLVLFLVGCTVLFGNAILTRLGVSGFSLRLIEPFTWLGMKYYLWFASGILFAKAKAYNSNPMFALACAIGLAAAVLVSPNNLYLKWHDSQAMMAVLVLFAAAQRMPPLQNLLQWRPLLFLGTVSYPLYLIHETIGLGMIILTDRYIPGLPAAMLPMPTLMLVIYAAYIITKYAEPACRKFLDRRLLSVGASAKARA